MMPHAASLPWPGVCVDGCCHTVVGYVCVCVWMTRNWENAGFAGCCSGVAEVEGSGGILG